MVSLLEANLIDVPMADLLSDSGEVFRIFDQQDSGCVSWGVSTAAGRLFVKYTDTERGMASLRRAEAANSTVQHPLLPALRNVFETRNGLALVYDWVEGELLYAPSAVSSQGSRDTRPDARARFRNLPGHEIVAALDAIYDLHVTLADAGYIAVDFYDGCLIYDFHRRQMHQCDLDEYRPGPFRLVDERLPGSTRFMAPEEFVKGARIDQATNVFTLARAAILLLGDGSDSERSWRGGPNMWEVVGRATQADPRVRYQTVDEFVTDWRAAVTQDGLASAASR